MYQAHPATATDAPHAQAYASPNGRRYVSRPLHDRLHARNLSRRTRCAYCGEHRATCTGTREWAR